MHCWECGNEYYGRIWKAWEGLKRGMRRRAAGKIENYSLDLYTDLKDTVLSGDAIVLP
jgi:hypothetical protein